MVSKLESTTKLIRLINILAWLDQQLSSYGTDRSDFGLIYLFLNTPLPPPFRVFIDATPSTSTTSWRITKFSLIDRPDPANDDLALHCRKAYKRDCVRPRPDPFLPSLDKRRPTGCRCDPRRTL